MASKSCVIYFYADKKTRILQRKLDCVSIEYVIPRCGISPSAQAGLNAPIYASSHDVHVRPFIIDTFTTCSKKKKKLLFEICFIFALPVLVCLLKKKKKKKRKKMPLGIWLVDFRQKVPWKQTRVAFSEVIFGENIGRTDKLSRSC